MDFFSFYAKRLSKSRGYRFVTAYVMRTKSPLAQNVTNLLVVYS